jgi:glyceraldehyde 3-phosphate dehydrogenase
MTSVRIAINGFGRIGRCVTRALFLGQYSDIELVAINVGEGSTDDHIHFLKYDSTHGIFPDVKKVSDDVMEIANTQVKVISEFDIEKIDWAALGVDVVLECTGAFTKRADAAKHIARGAKKVIISAPSPDADMTTVLGVNQAELQSEHQVISIGSCTTNCLAPVAKVLEDALGVEQGFMTTIHSYTNDQRILDSMHKDRRRARAGAVSMIPTSTGAAKALSLVIPSLKGKLDGTAIRVPTPNVSMVDLCVTTAQTTSVDAVNSLMQQASQGAMQGVLVYCDEELVSVDFNGNPASSVFDSTQTKVMGGNFVRVVSWYDNEWGFSNRMLEAARLLAAK